MTSHGTQGQGGESGSQTAEGSAPSEGGQEPGPSLAGTGAGICRSFVFSSHFSHRLCLQCELPGPWREEPCWAEPSSGVMGTTLRSQGSTS